MGAQTESELRQAVELSLREYVKVARQHEQFLKASNRSAHGSSAMVNTLRRANQLGPQVMMALHQYQDAVRNLAIHIKSSVVERRSKRSQHA
jgi:hypothetical protein